MEKPSGGRAKRVGHFIKNAFLLLILLGVTTMLAFLFYDRVAAPSGTFRESSSELQFDTSVSEPEKSRIKEALIAERIAVGSSVTAKVTTTLNPSKDDIILDAYVPVTNWYSATQNITKDNLAKSVLSIWHETDATIRDALTQALDMPAQRMRTADALADIQVDQVALIPISKLDYTVKLLKLDDTYYLDTFNTGAVFRVLSFEGGDKKQLGTLTFSDIPAKPSTLTYTQTGVTAPTRVMMRKLNEVGGNPKYFSEKIGSFLSSADITHVSNEVSFKDGCQYSDTSFCSDPRFIDTLKDSGVDVVELTGNHNNDQGSEPNTSTINLYRSLGWKTVGGGLNADDAAKYYVADQKGSKVALLGYNFADAPGSGAIASSDHAGANGFNLERIATDIKQAKSESSFVIVDVQYWECYAYPDGYVEYPQCDKPISDQSADFKKIIDLGADMVVGTQAHQPQYYELYKSKPIYYGLGNLYFDQTQWPGTERGIILTHYFRAGKLLQTKLSPTSYDKVLQTTLMPETEAESFLARLQAARQ